MVQEDSRIDQYQKMVKGESRIVWEWQGKLLAISRIERFVQNRMRTQRNQQQQLYNLEHLGSCLDFLCCCYCLGDLCASGGLY